MTTLDTLPDATHMGPVTLRTANVAALESWYGAGVGLQPVSAAPGRLELGIDGTPLLVIEEDRTLDAWNPRDAGLFHTAILYPTHEALAAAVVRMSRTPGIRFAGTGDHHVSEAFYFQDPEGNGVELYVDRPRDHWEWNAGQVHMTTEFIDPNAFVQTHLAGRDLDEIEPGTSASGPLAIASGSTIGHVHLQVGNAEQARAFYVDALGFNETASMAGSALFVSAGGYHHHMAMNVWNSRGAGKRPNTLGLGRVDIAVPGREALAAADQRLRDRGIQTALEGDRLEVRDPWDNLIRLNAA